MLFTFLQLRKTPGFTTTAVLTLALGIGANAAVFTLIHAVLLKNLPVAKPGNRVKLGDINMCCVGSGYRDDGDYALFSTAVYEHLKKNAAEFEELAAMQAGFSYRPLVIRRGGTQESARSVMGEFVSGYTDVRWKNHLMYFVPLLQRPPSRKTPIDQDEGLYIGAVVVKTSHPMPDMEALARGTLSQINPNLAVVQFQTFDAQIADRFSDDRMLARLIALFGALALLVASVGLYGVSAYSVARRTAEIGIRMALGAERAKLLQ